MFNVKIPFRPKSDVRKVQFFEKSVLSVSATAFFLFIGYGGITTFIPLFANSIKVNSGAFFLAYAATLALTRPIAGKLSDRYGETFVIVPALVIMIFAFIVLSFSTGLFGILVSAVLYGIGFGSSQPALQATTIRLAGPDRKGVASASLSTANDLGIGLGAIMLGWVSKQTSYQVLFSVSAMSVAFSLLVFSFFVRRLLNNKKQHILNPSSFPADAS